MAVKEVEEITNPELKSNEIVRGLQGHPDIKEGATFSRRDTRRVMYWKMCQDEGCLQHQTRKGWITTGPARGRYSNVEFFEFEQGKHATPLDDYGSYIPDELSSPSGRQLNGERFTPLIEKDGIKEFPLDQLIAYNWHRIDAVVKAVPRLKEVKEFPCEHGCNPQRRVFKSPDELQKHYRGLHPEVAAPSEMGKHLERAMQQFATAQNKPLSSEELIALVIAGIKAYEEGKSNVG